MQVICFEDERVEQLRPIVHARPAYAISCASFRLIDWLYRIDGTLAGHVRPYLRELQRLDYGIEPVERLSVTGDLLLVNARVAPTVAVAAALRQLGAMGRSGVLIDPVDNSLLLAKVVAKDLAENLAEQSWTTLDQLLAAVPALPPVDLPCDVFRWPHDVIAQHLAGLNDALQWRIEHEDHVQQADGVFVRGGVEIGEYVAVDTRRGPILLDADVQIGPFTYLSGPIHAGAGTRVIEHAAIKDGVALGRTVKLGGEVEASIIEPFTNKQHHGFLGHSYLGSWINLGAGTCNSDLKNTYGKINVEYGTEKVASNMQFLGCIMGDYSKTAINTSIFTGKIIGVCSMLYGFVTSNVPSFVNFARTFGQSSLLPAEVMITTQQRMFARRHVQQRAVDRQLIQDMYERSLAEHEAADIEIL